MYRWLHISDLHFKINGDPDQHNMITTILNACKSGEIQADFVVATGDFHNFADGDNFERSKKFLRELIEALGLDISSDLFIVPGNHDSIPSEEITIFIENIKRCAASDTDFDYGAFLVMNPIKVEMLLSSFAGYRHMACDLIETYDEHHSDPQTPEAVHVRTWNNRVNILHLNTAIISDGIRDHDECADIATASCVKIRKMLDNGLPTLVLGHHSFSDLHPSIRNRLIQVFNQTNVWAYLAGDRHRFNFHGEDYLIDRKVEVAAWPNIVVGKMAASAEDHYSQFGCIRYFGDTGKNTVTPEHLVWERNSSGSGLTTLGWESLRPFPMYAETNSKLYFDLLEILTETRKAHPSFQLMEIDETLYPKGFLRFELSDCRAVGDKSEDPRPLADFLSESWLSTAQNHLMIEGEGGIGKTVALLDWLH